MEFHKSDTEMMKKAQVAGPELQFLELTLTNNITEDHQEDKDLIDEKVIKWMSSAYMNKNLDMKVKSSKDIICILLDIILYQDSTMVNPAFTLLSQYFTQKKAIIQSAELVQILQDEQEVAIYRWVLNEIGVMRKEGENAESWMGNSEDVELLTRARQFIRRLEKITELCVYNPERKLDLDDKKKKKDDDDDEGEEGGKEAFEYLNLTELRELWDNEDPKICDDDERSDIKNQTLLKNLRAYDVAILIIKLQSLEDVDDQNSYLRVLEKCYIFLLKFVRNNTQNQKVMVQYIQYFEDDLEYGVHAWELIGEIFKNSDMLFTYNLVPLLKKAIKLIDSLPKETQKKTILLSFLNSFIKIKGVPRKENQTLISFEITS